MSPVPFHFSAADRDNALETASKSLRNQMIRKEGKLLHPRKMLKENTKIFHRKLSSSAG
jgi:hypothetical protein